jgi:hypothetical protein
MRAWILAGLSVLLSVPAQGKRSTRVEPEAAVRSLLEQLQPDFRRCYEHTLKRQAEGGQIVVSLSVSRSGRWRSARLLEATRGQATVGRCIVGHLVQARLPRLTESARLEVPIRLRPREP